MVQVPRSQHLRLMPTSGGAVSINVVRHNILSHREFGGLLSTTESVSVRRQLQLEIFINVERNMKKVTAVDLETVFQVKT